MHTRHLLVPELMDFGSTSVQYAASAFQHTQAFRKDEMKLVFDVTRRIPS